MQKSIFLGLSLVLAASVVNQAYDGCCPKNASTISVNSNGGPRPAIELRWAAAGSRSQVTFTPAVPLLIFAGLAVPMGLGSLTIHYLRTTSY